MLKLCNLVENDRVVERIMAHYEFQNVKTGFCRSSSNVVYWVQADDKLYFLRYTTTDERRQEEIQAEIDYILYLRANGVLANRPVLSKENSYVVIEDSYLAVLFEGVQGQALDDLDLTSEICKNWGRQLGRIHELSKGYQCNAAATGSIRDNEQKKFEFIDTMLQQPEDIKILEKAKQLKTAYQGMIKNKENYGLCHYDFEMDNVFLNQKNNQFSIIDFDDCMYHFYSIDLMQVLINIEEEAPEAFKKLAKKEFLSGYQQFMKLPEQEELQLAQKFILIYGYAKLTYCLAYPPQQEPDWMEEVKTKLESAKQQKRILLS